MTTECPIPFVFRQTVVERVKQIRPIQFEIWFERKWPIHRSLRYSSPEQVISELWGIICHMESHSVTCHL